jgi:hypothetical protein
MSIRGACCAVFGAAAIMTLASSPGRERAVVADRGSKVEKLEATVAAHPAELRSRIELAQAYLDADSPGLALSTLSGAPASQQSQPTVEHMIARVMIEQGRAKDALALERRVLDTCGGDEMPSIAHPTTPAGCDFWLVVSATRRAEILEQLVQRGVEDPLAQPEASLVAYHNATHEARLAAVE